MSETTRNKKVPPPYSAPQPSAGARGATDANWVKRDMEWKESRPQPDYRSGSGSGINNG